MRKNFYFSKRSIRNSIILFLLGVILITAGCYTFKIIIQPSSAETNSSFDVTIILKVPDDEDPYNDNISAHGYIGIILPDGWTVKDSIPFNKAGITEVDNVMDTVVYDAAYVDILDTITKIEVPDGYHWWGAKSINTVNMINFDTAQIVVTIYTNEVAGDYQLKYIIGDDEGENPRFPYHTKAVSDFMPITISYPASTGNLWKNEGWQVYPNPCNDYVYIEQESFNRDVKMTILDLTGRVQKTEILSDNKSYVDLSMLAKGTYLLALEKEGAVKTKKIIIQ